MRRKHVLLMLAVLVALGVAGYFTANSDWLTLAMWRWRGGQSLDQLNLESDFDKRVLSAALTNPTLQLEALQLITNHYGGVQLEKDLRQRIRACFESENISVREESQIAAVKTFPQDERRDIFRSAMKEGRENLRAAIANRWHSSGDPELWPDLVQAAFSDPSSIVRRSAANSLVWAGWEAIELLVGGRDVLDLPREARQAISRFASFRAVDTRRSLERHRPTDLMIRLATQDPDPSIRSMAMWRGLQASSGSTNNTDFARLPLDKDLAVRKVQTDFHKAHRIIWVQP